MRVDRAMDGLHDDDATTPEEGFGAELRRLREQAGLTARQLATELHRAHSGIVEYERGRRLPAVDVVEQYEDHFDLERYVCDLVGDGLSAAEWKRYADGIPYHRGCE